MPDATQAKLKCKRCLRNNVFVIVLVSCVVFGLVLGISLRASTPAWTQRNVVYFRFPGELLLRMLNMIIIPIVVSSIIAGMSSLDTKTSGVIGARALIYYLTTTFVSVIIGIILVAVIQPGNRSAAGEIVRTGQSKNPSPVDSFLDLIRNAIPDNLFSACFEKTVSVISTVPVVTATVAPSENITQENLTTSAPIVAATTTVVKISKAKGMNLLGLIVFSICFAVAISNLGEKTRAVREFFDACNQAIQYLVRIVLWYSPIGICFLIASKIVEMQNPYQTLTQLGYYMATVITGLVIHGLIILPFIYLVVTRKNPFKYMLGCIECLLMAVSTASSSATLPVTMKCVEENNKVDKRISRFVLPVGATVNMDGTALYEAVASIFIAQVNNVPLDAVKYIIISLTSTAAAIGAAGIPEAGLVTMVIVLEAVGLPVEDVTLILAIDWFLDRLRTTVNVWGDAIGAAVVERFSTKELKREDNDSMANGYIEDNPVAINMAYTPTCDEGEYSTIANK